MQKIRNLVLALNSGSSSVKVALLRGDDHLLSAVGERLGTKQSTVHLRFQDQDQIDIADPCIDHEKALGLIIDALQQRSMLDRIVAVGHRIVHGGSEFTESTIIDDEALERLEKVSPLAPLHNPYNVAGIKLMEVILPGIPNIAVFDTSFHATIPEKAFEYPLPKEYRDLQMRKFGFHGTSVHFVSNRVNDLLEKIMPGIADPEHHAYNVMVCHIGNGASVTAVVGGESRETSMGFTPLAGLMMGTRCGSVDPSLVGVACSRLNKSVDEVMNDFNKRSGLKGMVDGGDSDMRALLAREQSDEKARLAVDMFVYRLAQNIASSMIAFEGPLDALVFTAGIGEHSSEIRERTINALRSIMPTIELDSNRNAKHGQDSNGVISMEGANPAVLVIPTDEEAMIAAECLRLTTN